MHLTQIYRSWCNSLAVTGQAILRACARFLTVVTWVEVRLWLGKLANLAGFPGFVRECDYEAGVAQAHIQVRVRGLFTVVCVNGLDIYFHRLTGSIDGVGVSQACDCRAVSETESRHPDAPLVVSLRQSQTQTRSGSDE